MSFSCKSLLKRQNVECQTVASISSPDVFDFSADMQLVQNERPLEFQIERNQVEKLVSAVQGDDETIRSKYQVANHRVRRFRAALKTLKNQLDAISETKDESEFQFLKDKFIRELAYSIDPASRHGKGRKNLFDHQRYEYSLCDCQVQINGSSDFRAIYSFNETLYLYNENEIYYFKKVPSQNINGNTQLKFSYKTQQLGQGSLIKGNRPLKSISDDDKLNFLIRGLGYDDPSKMKGLINCYDFSFIDVILSLPSLTEKEAKSLMVNLYSLNFLSAYIRSKICQFIYERDQPRAWPELLGRFVSLLSQSWFNESVNDLMQKQFTKVINNLSSIGSHAAFLLQIIIDEFLGMERGDLVNFIWEFLSLSVFMNNYLRNEKAKSIVLSFYKTVSNKSPDSKTYKETLKLLKSFQNTDLRSKSSHISKFFNDILTNHSQDIITILQNIPSTKEEASPLFYPLALEIKEELESFGQLDNSDSVSDESSIVSNVESRMFGDSELSRSSSSHHSSRRNPRYLSTSSSSISSRKRRNDDSQLSHGSKHHHSAKSNSGFDDYYQSSSSYVSHSSKGRQSSKDRHSSKHQDSQVLSEYTDNFEEEDNLFEEEEGLFEEEEGEFEEEFIEEEEYSDYYN